MAAQIARGLQSTSGLILRELSILCLSKIQLDLSLQLNFALVQQMQSLSQRVLYYAGRKSSLRLQK